MAGVQTQARFFGLNLSGLQRDLFAAWRGMLDWPVLSWLQPKLPVRLHLPDGTVVFSKGPGTTHTSNPKRKKSARFVALQLPEQLLLRTSLQMPPLQPHELQAALALQVAGLSPFVQGDLVWAYEVKAPIAGQSGPMLVQLVMSSRKLIAQYAGQTHPDVDFAKTEVWVPSVLGPFDLLLPGFGESVRARRSLAWHWVSVLLLLLVLALVTAIALTPSIQLYLRVQQAHQAMASLQQKAAPVVKQRESMVYTTDQLNNLTELLGKPLPPLHILKLVTDALPDDTSLSSLRVQGTKVSMIGQTADATALMKQLGTTPGLRDVTAPTPATKPLGAQREQFAIDFTLDPVQLLAAK